MEKKGTTYHCVKVTYYSGLIEDIIVNDELGEDCKAYDIKDKIQHSQDEEDPIKSIQVIFLKDVVA